MKVIAIFSFLAAVALSVRLGGMPAGDAAAGTIYTNPHSDAQTMKERSRDRLAPAMQEGIKTAIEDYIKRKKNKENGKGRGADVDPDTMKWFKKIADEEKKAKEEAEKIAPDAMLQNKFTKMMGEMEGKEGVKEKNNREALEKIGEAAAEKRDSTVGNDKLPDLGLPFPSGFNPEGKEGGGGGGGGGGLSPAGAEAVAKADAERRAAEAKAREQAAAMMERDGKALEARAKKEMADAYSKMRDSLRKTPPGGWPDCHTSDSCEKECEIGPWKDVRNLVKVGGISVKCDHKDEGQTGQDDEVPAADFLRAAFKGAQMTMPKSANTMGGEFCMSTKLARLIIEVAQVGDIDIISLTGPSFAPGLSVDFGSVNGQRLDRNHRQFAIAVMAACKRAGADVIYNVNQGCGNRCEERASWVHCRVADDSPNHGMSDSFTANDPALVNQDLAGQPDQNSNSGGEPQDKKKGLSLSLTKDENGLRLGGSFGGFSASIGKGGLKFGKEK